MRKLRIAVVAVWIVGCLAGMAWLLSEVTPARADEPEVTAEAAVQTDKLVADFQAADQYFGASVALDQDLLIVGSPKVTSSLSGPSHVPGAARLFRRDPNNPNRWIAVKTLTAPEGQADDGFGISVAVSGDAVVVGAPGTDVNNRAKAGAAYVFRRNQGGNDNWGQVAKVVSADVFTDDQFGRSVAISGNTLVVGAHLDNVFSGTFRSNQGAAYVFYRDQGGPDAWGFLKKLSGTDCITGDQFGVAVALDGDTLLVGARAHDPNRLTNAGAAYLFERNAGGSNAWGEIKKLVASGGGAGDQFGQSVSIDGDTVVVGANAADIDGQSNRGATYVFSRNLGGPNGWGQVVRLIALDGQAGDQFGSSVSLRSDTVVVGAPVAEVSGLKQQGAAYVYERAEGGADNWGQSAKLIPSDGDVGDLFGSAVATSGSEYVVGAPRANLNYSVLDTGAVYVFVGNAKQVHLPIVSKQ
jgi:hypothetical protein